MYNGRRFTKSALGIFVRSTFRVSSINYYLVCGLPIHKIWALYGISSAISVLLTTENSDHLEIQNPHRSRSSKVTPANSACVTSYLSLEPYPRPYLVPFVRYGIR